MTTTKLVRVIGDDDRRISGTGGFPAPQKEDIGRDVVITRHCITWKGCLGYFADDEGKEKYAFLMNELEV